MSLEMLLERFDGVVETAEDVERLNGAIVDLAISGKLTKQNVQEEPAHILLEKIEAKKTSLYESGDTRKPKKLPKLKEDRIPFNLPENWNWAQLGKLVSDIHYGYTASADPSLTDVRMLRITDIQNNRVDWQTVPGCVIEKKDVGKYLLKENDILIARTGGTIGKSYIVENLSVKAVFASYLIRIIPPDLVYAPYLKLFLSSSLYWQQLTEKSKGTGQPNVNATSLSQLMIPVPPFEEQKRIVAKVDELLEQTRRLSAELTQSNSQRRKAFTALTRHLTHPNGSGPKTVWPLLSRSFDDLLTDAETIDDLKQTILQLAVQGRLVPQDPNDEPARVLLERIILGKGDLDDARYRRRKKTIKPLADDEEPNKLPNNWEWARLGRVGLINPRNDLDDDLAVSFIPMKLVPTEYHQEVESEERPWREIRKGYTHFQENDIAFAKITPCFQNRKSAVLRNLVNGFGAGTTELVVLRVDPELVIPDYVLLFFKTPNFIQDGVNEMTGTAGQQRVPKNYYMKVPFPLPPFEEQKRIVAKVDELLALCDLLRGQLRGFQAARAALRDAVLGEMS